MTFNIIQDSGPVDAYTLSMFSSYYYDAATVHFRLTDKFCPELIQDRPCLPKEKFW